MSPPFYLSVFSLVRDDAPQFTNQQLLRLKGTVREKFGWRRPALCFSMTGLVDEWFELYQIPRSASLFGDLAALEDLERQDKLNGRVILDFCRTRRKEVSRPMPYDPGLKTAPPANQGHLLYSILELKAHQEEGLIQAMTRLQDLFREKRWSLLFASRSLTPPHPVIHLWHLPEGMALSELLEHERYNDLERCCERQSHQLLQVKELE